MALREQTQRLLSQEDVTADNVEEMYGIEGIDLPDITAKDVGMFVAESTPVVGEAIALKRTSDALDEGDYVGAGIEATAGLLGLVPGVGDAAGKGLRQVAKSVRRGYNPEDPASRVFHLTKKDYDVADVIGSGTSDIGFHVGTAQQATARGSTQTNYDPELAEQMVKGERILPMVLKADLKPARIVDMSNFKVPGSWLANLSVASSDLQRIKFLKGDESDAALFAKAPKVKVDGETYTMLPDAMRAGMDEGLWRDIVLEAHGAKRRGLDTINSQEDRIAWFNTLKETANKNGYDSFVYRNEYEGTANENIDELVEQIQRAQRGEIDPAEIDMNSRFADSYMLLEPNQVKGLFGGMTESSPEFMKNKGGLMLQKGGAVPMKEQMEMFEDGGLEQDGGTKDPVSGNDVPPGSAQEEVRDDIPAQLSEGEFVFPADVVRYIGLEKLMMMRQEAKMGLKMMEEMGQMGNSDEATMPDDLPFGITDLIIVDGSESVDNDEDKEYNTGGVVFGNNPNTGVTYQAPQFQAGQTQVGMAASPIEMAPIARPEQQATPVYKAPQTLPTASEFIAPPEGQAPQTITIVNKETGEERMITFIPGVTEIPQGFVRKEDYVPKEVVPETPSTTVETATVREDTSDDDERRRKEEEARFGPGGGRIGIQGNIYGVSFDMPEGFMPGMAGAGSTALSLLSGKPLPENVSVNIKRDDLEVKLSGVEYNRLKQVIKDEGANSNAAGQAFEEIVTNALKREELTYDDGSSVIEQITKSKSGEENYSQSTRDNLAELRADQARRAEEAAQRRAEEAYRESQRDDDSSPAGEPTQYSVSSDPYSDPQEIASREDRFGEAGLYMARGGLAGKKKPKAKKMKRGGLASKK